MLVSASAQQTLEEYILAGYITVEAADNEDLRNQIEQWMANPLPWNRATIDDIRSLPVRPVIKERLLALKKENKTHPDWTAFQQASQLSPQEMETIRLFITLNEPLPGHGKIYHYTAFKRQDQQIHLTKNLQRGRWFHASGWFTGWMTENDQGEPQVWDHYKISLRSPLIKDTYQFHIGAYRPHFGQGLVFNSSLMNLKSSQALQNISAGRQRIANYLGTDENRFLWGLAGTWRRQKWQLTSFYSQNNLDAHVQQGVVQSLPASGIHRSARQLTAKNRINARILGVSGYYQNQNGQLGVLLFNTCYSRPLEMLKCQSYLGGGSLYHSFHGDEVMLSGEFAWLGTHRWATVQSLIYRLENIALCGAVRFFMPDFFTLLGGCPKEFGGMPNNEKGLYVGGEIKLLREWWLAVYMDFFSPIEPEDQTRSTPTGTEAMLSLRRRFSKGVSLVGKLKRSVGEDIWRDRSPQKKWQYKLRIIHQLDSQIVLTCRLARVVQFDGSHRISGTAISFYGQKTFAKQARLLAGTVHFHSQGYAARTYLYEPGIPLRFNMVCLHGTGYRYFVVFQKTFRDIFKLALAYKYQQNKPFSTAQWNLAKSIEFQLLVDI